MSESKLRDEFEAWHREQVNMLMAAGEPSAARSARQLEPVYWCAWQASRESLVIKLPGAVVGARRYQQAEAAFAHKEGIDECRIAIESIGLKVSQ